ncbi:hypothetical protein N9544_04540, partial [Flavobacteriales bacterium]|nr:hypothetical protein [Flavobacteriales bacterium]
AKRKAEDEAIRKANELASKEALEKTKREKEKRYSTLISKAENLFNENEYSQAKNTYASALKVKPNEVFPVQRIKAINEILNRIAQEKRSSIESTDDYFNIDADLYGTEVDMSGDDGTFLLTKIVDNSNRREYMKLTKYIDSVTTNNKKSNLRDIDFSQLTYQKFEELSDQIAKKRGPNDYGRYGNITSIGLYLNAYNEDQGSKNELVTKKLLANYDAIDKLNDKYIDTYSTLSKKYSGLGKEYQKYADNNAEMMNVNSLDHLKTNEEIFAELEEFKSKISQEHRQKQIKARENDYEYVEYSDLINDRNKKLADKESISQKFEIDYLESTVVILKEKQEAGSEKAASHNNEYEDYAEKVADVNNDLQKSSSIKTATTNKEIEELQDKIASEAKSDQERVRHTTEDYDVIIDKLAAKNEKLADANNKSQKRINEKLTDIEDNLSVQKSDGTKDELALLFPEGVTEKVYQKKNKYDEITSITVRRVVVVGNKGDDYLHKKSKTGDFYFKNGKSISETTWDLETSGK